ncbi:MAG TPA: GDYXXLXY domain-containing protein [Symbiobacteriaceae bacterium]|jgi:uncharacterized membrane-anchored protein|nr:GDYXXLXY domain-containing protein [Symbiobacteriaceae bacterium]
MVSKRWFWLAVALQVLLLLGMVGRHAYTVATGQPILLQTAPVDPWDMFRGEYVRLNYTISRIDVAATPTSGGPFKRGQAVWVVMQQGEPSWTLVAVHAAHPGTAPGQIALKATVVQEQWGESQRPQPMLLEYGIEQFYVPEGEGPKLEQAARDHKLTVQVLVDNFGRAVVHKVFTDGQEVRWR